MTTERYEHRHLDVVCELGGRDVATRTEEWLQIKSQSLGTEPITGGVRMWLPGELADTVRGLAQAEAQCCGFLDIEVTTQDGRVRLDITSAAQAAAPIIEFLRG